MRRTFRYLFVVSLLALLAGLLVTAALRPSSPTKWAAAGNLAGARADACAVVLSDGGVLPAGGNNGEADLASTEVFVPSTGRSIPAAVMSVVQAEPPEGFVATPGATQANVVDRTIDAVQFTIKDVGSAWTNTRVTHRLTHKGRNIVVVSTPRMINSRRK